MLHSPPPPLSRKTKRDISSRRRTRAPAPGGSQTLCDCIASEESVGTTTRANSTPHCHQPSRKGSFAPLNCAGDSQHNIRIGSVAAVAAFIIYFFTISSLAAAVASSGSCMAKFFYFQNKLKRAAQSLKASFQSRTKTQTDFLSPDPCMDVLIVR